MASNDEVRDPRMMAIATKLKQLRKDAGYTNYEHLAWELEMGRSQYSRLESGKNFTMETLLRILDAYGISPAEFFADITEKNEPVLERLRSK